MVQNSFSVAQINGCVSESNSDVVETVIGWLHHLSLCLCCNSVFVRYDARYVLFYSKAFRSICRQ